MPKTCREPSPKLKKLTALLPKVKSGEMTLKDAMLSVGYSESTATKGQTRVLGYVRNNEKLQDAFGKAGITVEALASKYAEGMDASTAKGRPDHLVRYKYVSAATQILDCFPSKRVEVSGDPDRPLFHNLPDFVKEQCAEITDNVAKHDS